MLTRITKALLSAGIGILVGSLGGSGPLAAQGTACNACHDICSVGWHWDDCGVAFVGWSGGSCWLRCEPGICSVAHPQNCTYAMLTPGEIDQVIEAAATSEFDDLAIYLRTSDQVHLNQERSAIQVSGCKGTFLASIAIPKGLAMRLALQLGAQGDKRDQLPDQLALGRTVYSTLW